MNELAFSQTFKETADYSWTFSLYFFLFQFPQGICHCFFTQKITPSSFPFLEPILRHCSQSKYTSPSWVTASVALELQVTDAARELTDVAAVWALLQKAPWHSSQMHISAEGSFKNRHSQLNLLWGFLLVNTIKLFSGLLPLLSPTHNSFYLPQFLDPSSYFWLIKNNNKAGLSAKVIFGSPPAPAEAAQVLGETTDR